MTPAQQAYNDAIQKEQDAWAALNGRLPGSSDYDPDAWQAWRDAVAQADKARGALASA
jgi:hypothetical protein